jgi:hypothetical protein
MRSNVPMPTNESALHRISEIELLLLHNYRHCTPERQDVLLYFSEEMVKQSKPGLFPSNVVSIKKP